jgi:putative ABC transport system substrate-binding protein
MHPYSKRAQRQGDVRMNHRWLLSAISFCMAVASIGVFAQKADRVAILGTLALGATRTNDSIYELMRKGLRELGYSEGRDYKIEHRSAEGHLDQLPALAKELVALKPNVIVTGTDAATRAAKQATATIPIVAVLPEHDPVSSGLIASFNQPGGNVTGLTVRNTQLVGKRLQVLKEIVPELARVAILSDSSVHPEVEELKSVAHQLHIQLQIVEMKEPFDFGSAYAAAKRQKAGAVMLLSSPQVYTRRTHLGALALQYQVASDAPFHDFAKAGGLMSYSTDPAEGFYRAAYFIDGLLRGAKPAELPFEQTANVRLIVTRKPPKRSV